MALPKDQVDFTPDTDIQFSQDPGPADAQISFEPDPIEQPPQKKPEVPSQVDFEVDLLTKQSEKKAQDAAMEQKNIAALQQAAQPQKKEEIGPTPAPDMKSAIWQSIQRGFEAIGLKKTPEEENAHAQNVYALSKAFNLPTKTVEQNYKMLGEQIIKRGDPTAGEFLSGIGILPIAALTMSHPAALAGGLIWGWGLTEAEKRIVQMKSGDVHKRRFSDLLPEESTQLAHDVVDGLVDLGTILGSMGLTKISPDISRLFTKHIITEYKLPQKLYFPAEKLSAMSETEFKNTFVRDMNITDRELIPLIQARSTGQGGVQLEVPVETIVRTADRPYWAKIKRFFNIEPYENVQVLRPGKSASNIVRGELPSPETVQPKISKEPAVSPNTVPGSSSSPLPAAGTAPSVAGNIEFTQDLPDYRTFITNELDKANAGRPVPQIQKEYQDVVLENPDQMRKNYDTAVQKEYETTETNIISAGAAKHAIDVVTPENSSLLHEPASAFVKYRFEELLSDQTTKEKPVIFTAGISGSGKTSAVRELGVDPKKSALIYDTNLNNVKSFADKYETIQRFDETIGGKRAIQVWYVHRDPIEAYKGVLKRYGHEGRIVSIDQHVKNSGSQEAIKEIQNKYPDVEVIAVDNTGKKGEQFISSLDKLPKQLYTQDELKSKLHTLVEEAYSKGEIDERAYRAAKAEQSAPIGSRQKDVRARDSEPAQLTTGGSQTSVLPDSVDVLTEKGITPQINQTQPGQETVPEDSSKRRKFIDTVKDAAVTAKPVAEAVESRYNPISNKETLKSARRRIEKNREEALAEVMGSAIPTAESNAIAQLLILEAQAAGRFSEAIDIVNRTAEKQTALGQAIQALSMYNRLTPEGILQYAKKAIDQATDQVTQKGRLTNFERLSKDLSGKDKELLAKKLGIPYLDEALIKELLEVAKRIQDMPDGREKAIQTALMLKKISDRIPVNLGKKVATIQTMAQLLNPKTIVRNVLGNLGFAAIENVSDSVGVALDAATALFTGGVRTQTFPNLKTQAQGFASGLKEGTEEALLGIDLSKNETKFSLPSNGVFHEGVLGSLEKGLNLVLRAPDKASYQAAYNESLRNQMDIAKISDPTPEMIEKAHYDGLYRTFQDTNLVSELFTKLKKALNIGKSFGLGDIVLKYPKTPANILARGIEYSPFGFVRTVMKLADPLFGMPFDQREFVRSTSRAFTGSALLMATGAILAGLGIISGRRKKDRDQAATMENVGLREYQVNVSALKRFIASGMDPKMAQMEPGDTLASYDWFLPSSIGLALGANMVYERERSVTAKTLNLIQSVTSASETLAEQPLVQGLKVLTSRQNIVEGLSEAAKGIPASFVPTVLNQIRQLTNNISRNTSDPNYFKEAYNKAAQRVPGLANTLPDRINTLGQPKEMYQAGTNNPFNVFLNPAFVTKYTPDPVSKMVLDIYEESGEKIQFPRVASTKIKLGKQTPEPIELNPDQYHDFQQYIGQKTNVLFGILAGNEKFLNLPAEERAKKLARYLSDINTAAKIEVLGYRPKRINSDTKTIIRAIQTDLGHIKTETAATEDIQFIPE